MAKLFPLHRAVSAANMSFGIFEPNKYAQLIVGEIILGVCFYLIAFMMLKIMEKMAIKKASLEMF
ncbi:MAG: hypothetical protein GX129_03845 [Clostridiales bacterium]|jgi:hypothetical protein|nr:hypothetical protein [Clostridiales bacterium]